VRPRARFGFGVASPSHCWPTASIGGVAVVAVGQHRDRCPAVGQQGQAGGGPLGEGEVGDGRPSASCGRAVSKVRDHRKLLAVMPSGPSTSARRESANGRPVSSSTSSWARL
jgi:hypothetical protein